MTALALPFLGWSRANDPSATKSPPKPRPAPVFIGDAVQPWGGATLLLAILREDSAQE